MGKRTLFYDYQANVDLILPSNKRLQLRLGEYDTMAEYVVCTVLDFEKYRDPKVDFDKYVSQKAKEHKVNLRGGVQLDNFMSALYKSFMVNSHSMLSDFIVHYRDDIRNLYDPQFTLYNDDKISQLDRLLKALEGKKLLPDFPQWLLPVVDYYRLIRNSVAHSQEDDDACKDAYEKIDINKFKEDYDVFRGKAPNMPDKITMDDFYLYSACIKHVANYLTMVLKGRVNWANLGNTHEAFNPKNIKKGTDTVQLVGSVLLSYNHRGTKDEIRSIIDTIKERKQEYIENQEKK